MAGSISAHNSSTTIFSGIGFLQAKINDINFHLTPNPEKRNAKILGNTLKTLASGHSGPVLPFLVKRDFLRKIEMFKDLTIVNTTQKSIKNE